MVRVVPALNIKRYYRISVEAGQFGPVLVRTWGRIGWRNMRRMVQYFADDSLFDALYTAIT